MFHWPRLSESNFPGGGGGRGRGEHPSLDLHAQKSPVLIALIVIIRGN